MSGSALVGWAGAAVGVAGLIAYVALVIRQPKTIRMLNGAGLLLTSLALFQSRMMTAIAAGPFAFATDATVVLLILSVFVQAMAGWRNRQAWDGVERRRPQTWDGTDRREARGWDGVDRRGETPWNGEDRRGMTDRRAGAAWDGADRRAATPPEGRA